MTFPAHQGLILGAKLRWPDRIDGTALCIGAAAPDLAYPLGTWLNAQSHTLLGLVVWSVPVTVVLAAVVRWRAADGVFANTPGLGPLRLRSYRVLGHRRPGRIVTVASAAVGAGSHVLVDGFTHRGRWGANALGLNDVIGTLPLRGELTEARALQYTGHVGGSLAFVALLVVIASTGRLERWYGPETVATARRAPATPGGPVLFWGLIAGAVVTAVAAASAAGLSALFLAVLALAVGTVASGAVVGRPAPRTVSRPVRAYER